MAYLTNTRPYPSSSLSVSGLSQIGENSGLFVLLLGLVIAAALLLLPAELAIGPYYWDTVMYLDGAHRIADGQTPHVDFTTPFGALTLYLYSAMHWVLPESQPMLAAQYANFLIAAPLMILLLMGVGRGAMTKFALAAPFTLVALLPINGTDLSAMTPGVDAFGIYNRQAGLFCYVLAAGLLFCRREPFLIAIVAICLAALLFLKVTAFACALVLVAYGVVIGAMSLRSAFAAIVAGPVLALIALQAWNGLSGAYVANILELVAHNSGSTLSRVVATGLMNLTLLGPLAVLAIVLAVSDRARAGAILARVRIAPVIETTRAFLSRPFVMLGVFVAFGIAIEHQNSGSNQFIYLWPPLLVILSQYRTREARYRTLVSALVMAAVFPLLLQTAQRVVRVALVSATYAPLEAPALGELGLVRVRPDQLEEARLRLVHQGAERASYESLAALGHDQVSEWMALPVAQVGYLLSLDEAISSLRAYEQKNAVTLTRLAAIDFLDPFAALLGRPPIDGLPIVNDPARMMATATTRKTIEALARADAILVPHCPATVQRREILERLGPALANRNPVQLSPCWSLYPRTDG